MEAYTPLAAIVAVVIIATVTVTMFYMMTNKVLESRTKEAATFPYPERLPHPDTTRYQTDKIGSF